MAEMAVYGIVDMSVHFLLHCKYWVRDGRTRSMHQRVQEVRSCIDYLLG